MFDPALLTRTTVFIALCRTRKETCVTVESCTGGLLGALLTSIPGASDIYVGGYVTYANSSKHQMVGVSETLLVQEGAVSEAVAHAMAQGGATTTGASLSVAITGIAGPGGGTATKPVGLVHISAYHRGHTHHRCHHFEGNRDAIRMHAIEAALTLLESVVEGGYE